MSTNKNVSNQSASIVPFNTLEIDEEFNCRTDYEDIEELAASIKAQGLITPLTVTTNGGGADGPKKVVSGFRRYHAMKMLRFGNTPIPVVVRTFNTDVELHLANLVENTARKDVHPADLARRLSELASGTYTRVISPGDEITTDTDIAADGTKTKKKKKHEGIDRKIIATQTGIVISHVNNLIRVHEKLAPAATKFWRKHDVPMMIIFRIAVLTEDEQLEVLHTWKENRDAEKTSGKKKKKEKGGGASNASDEDDGSSVAPPRSEVREKLQALQEKLESAKGTDAHLIKGHVQALRWALGEIKRL